MKAETSDLAGKLQLSKTISSIIGLPVFVLLIYHMPSPLFTALVGLASAIAMWEFSRLIKISGTVVDQGKTIVAGVVFTISFYFVKSDTLVILFSMLLILLLLIEIMARRDVAQSLIHLALTLFGICYVAWLLGFIVLLRLLPDGRDLVIFLFLVTWMGDAGAGLIGRFLGKHRLPAKLNPKKTWEGAIGGAIVAIACAFLIAPWLLPAMEGFDLLLVGASLGIFGQLGDLSESMIKRSVGAGNSGVLIPGHGGLLDRVDSLLFTAPVFYGLLIFGR